MGQTLFSTLGIQQTKSLPCEVYISGEGDRNEYWAVSHALEKVKQGPGDRALGWRGG